MSAVQAARLYGLLEQHDVACWVMGGWGVDALHGRVTRPHKDLDLLVPLSTLSIYTEVVRSNGFVRKLEWSESRPVDVGVPFESAFVDAHPDGRAIDVHVIDVDLDGAVVQLYDDPWPLPEDALSGRGLLGSREVTCVSRSAQLAMHSGYDLPEAHREDVRLLETMT